MHRLLATLFCCTPLLSAAAPAVTCTLEQSGDKALLSVRTEADTHAGAWLEMNKFRIRSLLATPPGKSPWLLIEVYAKAADGDHRIISAQKVFAPFVTGRMEVVEPRLGRSLYYTCGVEK